MAVPLNLPVSAQGEWAAKKFKGDPLRAAAYLPLAYQLLGEVAQRMALGGVGYGHRLMRLADGATIRVIRNGQHNLIEITTPWVSEEDEVINKAHGFLFKPQVNSQRIYPDSDPLASMRLVCEKNSVRITVKAPIRSAYGNQFAFFGADVYSWLHSYRGDGPERATSHDIFKNGQWIATLPAPVIGFLPVRVTFADQTSDSRVLVATVSLYGSRRVTIRCYTMDLKTELAGSLESGELHNDEPWPVRFRSTGTEGSFIFYRKEQVEVQRTLYPDPAVLSVYQYKIATATIDHHKTGIEVTYTYEDAGERANWSMVDSVTSTENAVYPTIDTVLADERTGNCGLVAINNQRGGSEYSEIKTTAVRRKEQRYPIALAYDRHGTRLVAYFLYQEDNKESDAYHLKRESSITHTFIMGPHPHLPPPACEVFEDFRATEATSVFTRTMSHSAPSTASILVNGTEIFREQFNTEGTSIHQLATSTSAIGGRSANYGRTDGEHTDLSITDQREAHFCSESLGVLIHYINLRDMTYCIQLDKDKGRSSVNFRYQYSHHGAERQPAVVLENTRTISYANTTQSTREYKTKVNNKAIWSPIETHFSENTRDNGLYGFFVTKDPPNRSYRESNSFLDTTSFGYATLFSTPIFYYVNDERFKCKEPAWAYSFLYRYPTLPDHVDSVCTYGKIGPLLPVLAYDADQAQWVPTPARLTDPRLTVFPIGLF